MCNCWFSECVVCECHWGQFDSAVIIVGLSTRTSLIFERMDVKVVMVFLYLKTKVMRSLRYLFIVYQAIL